MVAHGPHTGDLQIVETHVVDDSHIFALAYCEELNMVLAAGASGFIKAIPLQAGLADGSDARPDCLYGHTQQVSALAVLKNFVLASAGHDQEIRFWDLHTMQEIEAGRKVEAHQAPTSGLAYCAERDELASIALENVAKVWDVRLPHASRLRFQVEVRGEMSQFIWISWRSLWCSFSGDGVVRLWSTEGEAVFQFNYNGGLVQTTLVDGEQRVVLAAMQVRRLQESSVLPYEIFILPVCRLASCRHERDRKHLRAGLRDQGVRLGGPGAQS